ncbi:protein of unknown function DUF164 [Desulforamulus reducens MI-1]|uniref:Uncharacterized protein n=1 Tax=Desulforamulus reducens (strain ATCC BAA-1160 / DSM 100696 / MI-1) TaxID=349161 RepID=A4J7B5_DESRM|nr:C4-type zinc ribbon domain-containing protein [Desulforamulus reducens]ABO50968.1 protein of unknown function DUF164 [Desulforamulus reducens MI-1]
MNYTRNLWQLQLLEKYHKSMSGKKPGNEIIQQLQQLKKEIEAGQMQLKELKTHYQRIKEQSFELEQKSKETRGKCEQINAKIYDGTLHVKEIQGCQQRVERLKQDISRLEDLELEKMQIKEDIKKQWESKKGTLELLKTKYKELHSRYLQEKEEIKERTAETARKMEELIQNVDKDLYKQYRQLKTKFPDPVGRVTKDACSGCHLGISFDKVKELKYEKGLVYCNHCGRILFWDPQMLD